MAKDPAFLFYPNDFIGGTMGMTLEEKGAYLELLILQFNKGAFTLQQAKKSLGVAFDDVWLDLQEKFTEENGKFFNKRLELEKEKRRSHSEKQKENIARRWNKKESGINQIDTKSLPIAYDGITVVIPLENEIENEIRIEDEIRSKGVIGENSVLFRMWKMFCELNPAYLKDQSRDLPELLKITQTITGLNNPSEDFLPKWKSIVEFIISDNWLKSYSIKQINNNLQSILLKKENNGNNTGSNKKSSTESGTIKSDGRFGSLRSHNSN